MGTSKEAKAFFTVCFKWMGIRWRFVPLSAGLLRPGSFFKGDGALVKKDCRG